MKTVRNALRIGFAIVTCTATMSLAGAATKPAPPATLSNTNANGEVDNRPPEVKAEELKRAGFGASAELGAGTSDGTDAFGLGIGARAGYTLRNNVYFGGLATYHFGS